jgi:hypothetical protein
MSNRNMATTAIIPVPTPKMMFRCNMPIGLIISKTANPRIAESSRTNPNT